MLIKNNQNLTDSQIDQNHLSSSTGGQDSGPASVKKKNDKFAQAF